MGKLQEYLDISSRLIEQHKETKHGDGCECIKIGNSMYNAYDDCVSLMGIDIDIISVIEILDKYYDVPQDFMESLRIKFIPKVF